MIPKLTTEQFSSHIANNDMFIVDFHADWCSACVSMMPRVEELYDTYKENIPFYTSNIDDSPELKELAKIKAIPMLLVYHKGHMRSFAYGLKPVDHIKTIIDRVKNTYDT